MKVVLGIDFDQGSWPGPLAAREAAAGEIWVGPLGLLGLLETALGTGGPATPALVRVARVVPAALGIDGFWNRSAELDTLAVARALLSWRDRLWLQGWRGEAHTERLGQLARVTEGAGEGVPDRIVAVLEALSSRSPDIGELELCEPREAFAPLWRHLFEALEGRGCRLVPREVSMASARGDLLAARQGGLVPEKDGSLQLLRPHGALQAAEMTAVWLAGQTSLAGTVVIGGDAILDSALARHGLPTLGGAVEGDGDSLLGVVPLIIRLVWQPPHPQAALDLLNLAVSPVPGRVGWKLRRALEEWPAVGSEAWDLALVEGLAGIEEEGYRSKVADRLELIFRAVARRGDGVAGSVVRERVEAAAAWMRARAALEEESGEAAVAAPDWSAGLQQCRLMLAILDAMGKETLTPPELDGAAAEATAAVRGHRRHPAQAGLADVGAPGGLAGPARRVVWWAFTGDSAPAITRWPVSAESRRALSAAGVELPELGVEAESQAMRWRRPLMVAEEALLLVCPWHGEDGREQYTHPLWDEVVGRNDHRKVAQLEVLRPIGVAQPAMRAVAARPVPAPRRTWQAAPQLLPPREQESPSSLGGLLGCSLQWALNYRAKLRPDRSFALADAPRSRGSLLHEVVERALVSGAGSAAEAKAAAERLFEELGPRLDARLFLPGAEEARADLRRVAGDSVERLVEILNAVGRRVEATELSLVRPALGARVGGRLDLVLGDSPAVIDLKLGGANFRRQALENGAVEDLAIYSHLLRVDARGPFPPAGYFILVDQELLTHAEGGFPVGEPIDGPGLEAVWRGLVAAVRGRREELAQGLLEAPDNLGADGEEPPKESGLVSGRLVKQPPCRFCDFAALCGRLFAEEAG